MKKRDLDCHQDLSFHRWAVSLLTNSTRGKDTHTARACMRAYSNSSRLTATQTSHQEGYRYYLLYHISNVLPDENRAIFWQNRSCFLRKLMFFRRYLSAERKRSILTVGITKRHLSIFHKNTAIKEE